MPDPTRDDARVQVILGAGLAGLSLAVQLVRHGVREPIVVVDQRTEFGRDRTWCTWASPDLPFLELSRHHWSTWEVVTTAGAGRGTSRARPYVHIDSADFYAVALDELERAANVEVRLGERVTDLGDGWAQTSRERLEGQIHDGLAMSSPALRQTRMDLWQAFHGWEVQTDTARFDPGVATLMDFRVDQDEGVNFLYVLPYAPDRALVEHTSFARGGPARHKRRKALAAYLGDGYEIVHEERGRLPMTTAPIPARRSERTNAIGIAGGALRPSSGYAFSRVQAHSIAIARAVAAGQPTPERAGLRRRGALDNVFLHALATEPEAFPERFRALVERVPGTVFARFMTDQSSPRDEARVMAALPVRPFARAAIAAASSDREDITTRIDGVR